jgi:formiminoglutamate deiminase
VTVTSAWWCEHAWLPGGPAADVRIRCAPDGMIKDVAVGVRPEPGDHHLSGLVLPGFANTHSHAFHRALRGRTHGRGGTFWTWRDRMYALADKLDPDTYGELATAVYAEMALAGITCVGEFHYLHHGPGGARYGDPNAMGEALRTAAKAAGVRLTLLDTCYLRGGIDDQDAESWATRVSMMDDDEDFRVAAAVHSVRAVPADQLDVVVEAAVGEDGSPRPLHVHVSEQPAENEACQSAYGSSPTELLSEHGVLGSATTAVHATHVSEHDIRLLGESETTICVCPTTERDLADGMGPARALADAGAPLTLGTDQHVMVDMLAEGRGLEMHERLRSGQRGRFTVPELLEALAPSGHMALGWPEAGHIQVGALCDLVSIRLDTLRTAGALPEQVLLVAAAGDVDTVVVSGRLVVEGGRHVLLEADGGPGVPERLAHAVARAWNES